MEETNGAIWAASKSAAKLEPVQVSNAAVLTDARYFCECKSRGKHGWKVPGACYVPVSHRFHQPDDAVPSWPIAHART